MNPATLSNLSVVPSASPSPSKGNLYEASAQWASRPEDERYESLQAMLDATKRYAEGSRTSTVYLRDLRVEATGQDLALLGQTNVPARLTHYAFGQLARTVGAPAAYLRSLPAALASTCLNEGLRAKARALSSTDKHSLLCHQNGSLVARALTTDSYDRVWNYEIASRIQRDLVPNGWQVPPARPAFAGQKGTRKATRADLLPNQADFGLAIKEGDDIAPAGLYASDHDMFAFLVNQVDPAWDGKKFLHRGVFIQNSEVGDCSLKFTLFTYDNVCGNHIVWGAGEVTSIAIRHIKSDSAARGNTLRNALHKWHVASQKLPTGSDLSGQIIKAKEYEIASTKDEVLDAVFAFGKKRSLSRLNRPTLEAAYDLCERTPRYGAPTTVWGMVNGLTEYSQTSKYADERNDLDVQAGRLMEMAF